MWRHRGKAAIHKQAKERAFRGSTVCCPLVPEPRPPEHGENRCLLSNLLSLWYFVRQPGQTNTLCVSGNGNIHTQEHTNTQVCTYTHTETHPALSHSPPCAVILCLGGSDEADGDEGLLSLPPRPYTSLSSFREPRSPWSWFLGECRVLRDEPQSAKVTLSKETKGK